MALVGRKALLGKKAHHHDGVVIDHAIRISGPEIGCGVDGIGLGDGRRRNLSDGRDLRPTTRGTGDQDLAYMARHAALRSLLLAVS